MLVHGLAVVLSHPTPFVQPRRTILIPLDDAPASDGMLSVIWGVSEHLPYGPNISKDWRIGVQL